MSPCTCSVDSNGFIVWDPTWLCIFELGGSVCPQKGGVMMKTLLADSVFPEEMGKLIEDDIRQEETKNRNGVRITYEIQVIFDRSHNPFGHIYKEEW